MVKINFKHKSKKERTSSEGGR
jgi:hypothetical protein